MTTETKAPEKGKRGVIDKDGAISISFSIKHEDLTFGELIGEGGFGKVYKGELDFNLVAIKTFTAQDFTEKTQKAIRSEASVMASVSTQSSYLVKLQGLVLGRPQYALVMEYMPGGDLYHLLHNEQDIAWSVRYQIGRDVSAGLHHLHKNDILHRDLKSLNILLDLHHRAKLADFGLTTLKSTSASATKGVTGTVAWSAPEVLGGEDHSVGSDIYSLGMVLWEMASRKVPYAKAGKLTVMMAWIMAGRKEEVPTDCPTELKTMIQDCWKKEPETRPTAADLVKRLDMLWKTQRALEEKKEKPSSVERSGLEYDIASGERLPQQTAKPSSDVSGTTRSVKTASTNTIKRDELVYDLESGQALAPVKKMAQEVDSGRPLVLSPLALITKKPDSSSSGGSAPLVMTPPISLPRPPASLPPEQGKVEEIQQKLEKLRLEKQQREMQKEIARLEAEAEKEAAEEAETAKREAEKAELKKSKPRAPVPASDFFAKEKTPLSSPVSEKKPVVDTKAVEGLLKLVVEGEQEAAEKRIKEKPELLLAAGKVTDLSGRTFENTTAFQYAVWALDWHMWKMLLKYVSKEEAAEQLEVLESKGLGKHGNQTTHIAALIEALQEQIEKVKKWEKAWFNKEKLEEAATTHWQKVVGGAQRLLPVHVVNEYCREDRSFDPTPKFLEDVLPRTRKTDGGKWFTGTYNGGLLGEKFGVLRAGSVGCGVRRRLFGSGFYRSDTLSLQSLLKTRTQQKEELEATLKSASRPSLSGGKS